MKSLLRILYPLFIFMIYGINGAYADGSRDLYPARRDVNSEEIRGFRAVLISTEPSATNPFSNNAAHYVYARVGETIAVASSAQGIGDGRIILTAPDGIKHYISVKGDTVGQIIGKDGMSSRTAELAGPRVGYKAFEVKVSPDDEGVWKVEFIPPTNRSLTPDNVLAKDPWKQQMGNGIAAWDISVRDSTDDYWISGRVYTNVLNLYLSGALNNENRAFYGKNYVLTRDGYIYQVDGNGSHGISFYCFVNSSGLLDKNGNPSYKSSNDNVKAPFHSPNSPDNNLHVTHKMLYAFPDINMPQESRGAVPGGSTWLYKENQIADIQNVKLRFLEGNQNFVTKKGIYIDFTTNYAARYKITISPQSSNHEFPRREIIYSANEGENSVLWDGLDGNGKFVPAGDNYPISISVALIEGEVHFPYFDMEINPNGIKIYRINNDQTVAGPAIVYWDDIDITPGADSEVSKPQTNLGGISSELNGHKWGTYRLHQIAGDYSGNDDYGQYSYGNNKAMDTWSYTSHVNQVHDDIITVKIADLEIASVSVDKTRIELGDSIHYTILVKNNGPSDAVGTKFEYSLPVGFKVDSVQFSADCGIFQNLYILDNIFSSHLDLLSGCEMKIDIAAHVDNVVPDQTYGVVSAEAGIVRPLGYIDPDATSSDTQVTLPGTASFECNGTCNNIMINRDLFLLEPINERGQLSLTKTVRHIDRDGSSFQEEGEELEYKFTIVNTGLVRVNQISIIDSMLGSTPFIPNLRSLDGGEESTYTTRYTLTANDVARKYVENTAVVMGKNPRGFDVKDISGTAEDNDNPTTIAIYTKPILHLIKKVINQGTGENKQFTIGDKINYEFTVKHIGDIPVKDIYLSDPLISTNNYIVHAGVLHNQSVTYHLDYTIREGDIANGVIYNSALAFAVDQNYRRRIEDISGVTSADDDPTVTVLAKPPVGVPDSFDLYQGHERILDILANDREGSSSINKMSIEVVEQPRFGSVRIDNGKLIYKHTSNFDNSADRIVYRLKDNSRLSSANTVVEILVNRTIPVAVKDNYTVGYNYQVKMALFENDYVEHSELLPQSIRITSHPRNGSLTSLGNGFFEYRPYNSFTGFDEFKYIVQDKNGNSSNEAVVSVEVVGFFFPNTITPNGDGKNDAFVVLGVYKFDHVELEIINRFGQSVFQSSNYKNDWAVPASLPEGTYYYIFKGVKSSEKPVVQKGTVLIKREAYRF